MNTDPRSFYCTHFDDFNGVRVKCGATPGTPCHFIDALGNRHNREDFHDERLSLSREVLLKEYEDPFVEEFVKALKIEENLQEESWILQR